MLAEERESALDLYTLREQRTLHVSERLEFSFFSSISISLSLAAKQPT